MEGVSKALITGGSGFIGTRLAEELLGAGMAVRIFDLKPSRVERAEFCPGDILAAPKLAQAAAGVDVIFHLAAEHRDDVRPLSRYTDVNVHGTENVIRAAEAAGVARIVFTSSVAVYRLGTEVTESTPREPFNEYGRTKALAEDALTAWASRDPTRSLTIVRPSVVFGEGNRGNVYTLMSQIRAGRFLMVGDGRNKKSMSYVGNIVRFLRYVGAGSPGVRIMNYADKPDLQTCELIPIIARALGREVPSWRVPYSVALAGGVVFDLLAALTGSRFPFSRVRLLKFCATTSVSSAFPPPFPASETVSLDEALRRTVAHEFGTVHR